MVYAWSPAPDPDKRKLVTQAVAQHTKRRLDLRWVHLSLEDAILPGESAVQVFASEQLTLVAWFGPKEMVVFPGVTSKPAPLIVTVVPPELAPEVGLRLVTASAPAGGAATYVN